MTDDLPAATGGTGKRAMVNGIDMYYEERGAGAPVLLLHGGIVDHRSWRNQIQELAGHFRVIAPDTRAHGRSTDTGEPLSYELFAADVVAFLRVLGIDRTHVIGFSDGGATALLLGAEHPALIDRLVCISSPYHTSNYHEGIIELLAKITPETLYRMVGPEYREAMMLAEAVHPNRDSWITFWRRLVNDLWTRQPDMALERLADVRAPTLVLHAEHEQFFAREHAEDMARTIPDARLEIIAGATHAAPQERPDEVNAAVMRFLSEC